MYTAIVDDKMDIDDSKAEFIDEIDRMIIVATQAGLPLDPRPYEVIAIELGLSSEQVIQRMQRMQDEGIIRRIGAVPNHYKLGYKANGMTVWNVPDAQVKIYGEQVGALRYVSHCYHRPRHMPEWPYNLFAMVHANTRSEVTELAEEIASLLGNANLGYDILFSSRILKKTGLRLSN